MKPSVVLRITSLITLILAVGHYLGGVDSWSPVGETEVLKTMQSFRFDTGGMSRTYFDFYLGFGFILSVYLLLQAVLLLAACDPRKDRGTSYSSATGLVPLGLHRVRRPFLEVHIYGACRQFRRHCCRSRSSAICSIEKQRRPTTGSSGRSASGPPLNDVMRAPISTLDA